jgi:hypothetical protein
MPARSEKVHFLDESRQVDRANEQAAPFMGKGLLGAGDGATRARNEEDVDVFGVGQFAHALDSVQCTAGVGIDENNPWMLHCNTSDEHRRKDVDHRVTRFSESARHALRLEARVGHEHRGDRPRGSTVVGPCSGGQGYPPSRGERACVAGRARLSSHTPRRSPRRGKRTAPQTRAKRKSTIASSPPLRANIAFLLPWRAPGSAHSRFASGLSRLARLRFPG